MIKSLRSQQTISVPSESSFIQEKTILENDINEYDSQSQIVQNNHSANEKSSQIAKDV